MSKIILHIDLNAFFVRCEEIKNPSLIGKPVAVGGDGRAGIVSTCSYKAREFGIHSGMPMFQAKQLCKDLIILPCDFKFYQLMSNEFFQNIKEFCTKFEKMSIDECFCDITEDFKLLGNNNIYQYLENFQKKLYKKTKLMCSIGVSTTKFLAKMGSDYKKPMGITIIRKRDIKKMLFNLPVGSFYGIGKKTYPKLNNLGIKTIGDLYNFCLNAKDNKILEFQNDYILSCLDGTSDDAIEENNLEQKSIGTTRTLNFDTNDTEELIKMLNIEFDNIYSQLISIRKICKTIKVVYKYAKFDNGFKEKSFSKTLKIPTDNKDNLYKEVLNLFNSTYDNKMLRLIGITFQNLENKADATIQMTFDNYKNYENENKTFLLINELNRKANKKLFFRASELLKNNNGNK